jgi:proteic killer suppression protein
VEIRFASGKLANICNSQKQMRGKLGPKCAARLQQRLDELSAAETLEDMRDLPGARCHELTHDRKGQLAVDLVHPRRLIFEPGYEVTPSKPDGGPDWSKVTRVVILEVVDDH